MPERFAPYFGVLLALIIVALVYLLSGGTTPVARLPSLAASITASSTITVLPSITAPILHLPGLSANATSTSKTELTTPATPAPSVAAPTQAQFDASASALRSALVNIICYAPAGSGLHSISGSGVIIDPKGYILTNAHIAQYFLLADKGVSCTVRTGSPAADAYIAGLAYISPAWVTANDDVLLEASPTGTGEHDFALLGIVQSASSMPLPTTFPYLPLATTPPSDGAPVVIASYAAQFLQTSSIESSLFPTVVFGSIQSVYTFGTNTVDVLDLGGSAAAQEGSSGGGVASASGTLVGTITTSTVTGDTANRSLDAITASYIRADYASETSAPLDLLLAEPVNEAINSFALKIPGLEAEIELPQTD